MYYIYYIYIYIYTYQWSSCFNTAGKFQSSYLYSFPIRTIENLQELCHPVASTVKGHSDLMIDQHLPHWNGYGMVWVSPKLPWYTPIQGSYAKLSQPGEFGVYGLPGWPNMWSSNPSCLVVKSTFFSWSVLYFPA